MFDTYRVSVCVLICFPVCFSLFIIIWISFFFCSFLKEKVTQAAILILELMNV